VRNVVSKLMVILVKYSDAVAGRVMWWLMGMMEYSVGKEPPCALHSKIPLNCNNYFEYEMVIINMLNTVFRIRFNSLSVTVSL